MIKTLKIVYSFTYNKNAFPAPSWLFCDNSMRNSIPFLMGQWNVAIFDLKFIYQLQVFLPFELNKRFSCKLIKTIPWRSLTTRISLKTMSLLPIAFVIAYLTAHLEATYWICWFYCLRLSKWSSSSLWRIFCRNKSCDVLASMFFIRLFWTKSTPMPKIFI